MPYLRRSIASFLVILIAAISFETCAQMPGGNRGRPDGGRQQGNASRSETRAVPTDLMNLLEYRLETMQEDLKLMPNQYRLWDAYSDKVRALGEDIVRERDRAREPSIIQPTAPQQIERMLDVARNRMTALEDIATTAKALYASLTTEQKLLADSRVASLAPLLAGDTRGPGATNAMRQKPPSGGFERGSGNRDAGPPR